MATSSQRIVRGFGIYEVMKEHRPAKLVAFDADGDPVTINVPEIRQRHARVLEALKGIAWTRVDLFDKKGGLLCRHQRNADDRDAVATDLEELGPGPTTRVAELAGLVSIMLRAQEAVLNSTQRQMQGVFEAQNRIMDAMLRRFDLQERQHQEAMELNHQLSADLVAAQLGRLSAPQAVDAEGNPRPESDRAISALMPQIMRALFVREKGSEKTKTEPTDTDKAKKKHANGSTSNGANGANGAKPEQSTDHEARS